MTRRKLKFVRYADDFSIYSKSHNQAKATAQVIAKFLKTKLQLTINTEKIGIRRPVNFTLLGFGFVPTYQKGSKNQYQLVVGKNGQINHHFPVQIDHQYRSKLTTTFQSKLTT